MQPVPDGRTPTATLRTMPTRMTTNRPNRASPEVTGLIDRIKRLVAEQRRMDEDDGDHRGDANRREISRLKWRLANAVKRELSPGPGLQPALALGR
jgi:hypothetical protein